VIFELLCQHRQNLSERVCSIWESIGSPLPCLNLAKAAGLEELKLFKVDNSEK
jgi:hypothetical protein